MALRAHGVIFVLGNKEFSRITYSTIQELKSSNPTATAPFIEKYFFTQFFMGKKMVHQTMLSPQQAKKIFTDAKKQNLVLMDESTPTDSILAMMHQMYSKTEANKYSKAWFEEEKKNYLSRLKKTIANNK
jgi:hypothetical protein